MRRDGCSATRCTDRRHSMVARTRDTGPGGRRRRSRHLPWQDPRLGQPQVSRTDQRRRSGPRPGRPGRLTVEPTGPRHSDAPGGPRCRLSSPTSVPIDHSVQWSASRGRRPRKSGRLRGRSIGAVGTSSSHWPASSLSMISAAPQLVSRHLQIIFRVISSMQPVGKDRPRIGVHEARVPADRILATIRAGARRAQTAPADRAR